MSGIRPSPIKIEMAPGTYWWCACGESEKQPFCDGSHARKKTGKEPMQVTIAQGGKIAWCGCRQSGKKPFCDGTHRGLPGYVPPPPKPAP